MSEHKIAPLAPGWLKRQVDAAVERRKLIPDWLRRIERQSAEAWDRITR